MIITKKNNSIAKLLLGGVNHLFHALAASRCHCCTLFEIFIFCPKIQLWFPEKNCRIVLGESSWKCCGFGLFSCWQLWFHEKNCQKIFGWKTRENVGDLDFLVVDIVDFPGKIVKFCQNWIFWTKIKLFEQCVLLLLGCLVWLKPVEAAAFLTCQKIVIF